MPHWFLNRPTENADPTERLVAEKLNQLEGDWYIRWGYYYSRGNGHPCDREGDFVILGPDGRMLVMEVKSGLNRHFALTGEWEHNNDNPAVQLHNEWQAVIRKVKDFATPDNPAPYIGKALCLPHVNIFGQEQLSGQLSRDQLVFGQDLDDFAAWWQKYIHTRYSISHRPKVLFHQALAPGLSPESVNLFIRQSDRLFDRFKASELETLSLLRDNQQWLVEGGVGTGKTFLALQQAIWLAESPPDDPTAQSTREDGGKNVLFLVYNLLLAERIEQMVQNVSLQRGSITVRSWEALMMDILAIEDLGIEVPDNRDPNALREYYIKTPPGFIQLVIDSGKLLPRYDALVVDEAQDHDTHPLEPAGNPASETNSSLGWWEWYFALLHKGHHARIALFYDPDQRASFRPAEGFNAGTLRKRLSQPVHVHLRKSLRYTRPVLQYLKTLHSSGTKRLIDRLYPHNQLPAGPEVEHYQCPPESTADTVGKILLKWKRAGLCQPTDVVLIGMRKSLQGTSLANTSEIAGYPLVDYSEDAFSKITYCEAHRSKGLDFLAVILIDFPPFDQLQRTAEQEAFFLGASRTRQLLAIVECRE